MSSYLVTSDTFHEPKGAVVSSDQLAGCNIAALVEGGHLSPVDGSPPTEVLASPPVQPLAEVLTELHAIEQTVESAVTPPATPPEVPIDAAIGSPPEE